MPYQLSRNASSVVAVTAACNASSISTITLSVARLFDQALQLDHIADIRIGLAQVGGSCSGLVQPHLHSHVIR